jgi:hypothetical protein
MLAASLLAAPGPARAGGEEPGRVTLRRGLVVDWSQRHVEVAAEVVAATHLLEVFACTPGTKEHETILRVPVPAEDIYKALGLIGLTPGTPVQWDRDAERYIPPAGDRVDVFVRFRAPDGRPRSVPAVQWLRDVRGDGPVPDLPWVFAGSYRYDDGTFAADAEGVVVALVNFSAALLAPPVSRTDADAELWIGADTDAIPEPGTHVTMILRPAAERVTLEPSGTVRIDGTPVTGAELYQRLTGRARHDSQSRVRLALAHGVTDVQMLELVHRITSAGIRPSRIQIVRRPATPTTRPLSADTLPTTGAPSPPTPSE